MVLMNVFIENELVTLNLKPSLYTMLLKVLKHFLFQHALISFERVIGANEASCD